MKGILPALLAVAVAGAAWGQNTNDPRYPSGPQVARPQDKGDWEIEQERRAQGKAASRLPAWPKDENLIEFDAGNVSSFRFFIDAASLSVSNDLVVRYALVARSRSGVTNYSYEGMRCGAPGGVRVYAYGQDGRWVARDSEWRDIDAGTGQRWHSELSARIFCPKRATIQSAAEGLDALRRGGHPSLDARFGN